MRPGEVSAPPTYTMHQKGSEGKAIQSEGETGRVTTAAQRLRPIEIISSTGTSQVLCVSLETTIVFRVISQHDRESSEVSFHARHERALFSREDEKDQK